ncbi:DUF2752 domain-containing protein [Ancylomarina euxinus]|uniref:DUF2752 domain-containing protein n=1 Tax=Ancylomarina euxinus TaxID=2283627 RepID=A0A425Y8G4_9BACT|nr:DUF2752 domain-containing protein [Ancylomarina euxinus]MCZ4693349.1 DUF2752 domain-containing protein [Ancylomarina euxinus]MUP13577.1 DUF2752 domain-containing protein [Ancylomarina euxinus]RRG24776.1 DUF2752 domain-containing protein [Ancylomarina euxinus]
MPKKQLYQLVTLLSVLAYGWLIYNSFFTNTSGEGITVCWFKTVSGLPCPACGSTSGIVEIFKGNFYKAFQYNPFAYSSLFILIASSFWVTYDISTKKDGFYRFYLTVNNKLKKKRIIIPIILLFLIIWMWNIYKAIH